MLRRLLVCAALLTPSLAFAQDRVVPNPSRRVQEYVPVDATTGLPMTQSTGGGVVSGATSNGSDGQSTTTTNVPTASYNYVFNGTTWDRLRGGTTTGAMTQGPETAGGALLGGGNRMMGSDGTNARDLLTDSVGSLTPANATPSTAGVIAFTGGTAAQLIGAGARVGLEINLETANTAVVYVCYTVTTTCSATVHDAPIPISTAIGTLKIPLFAPTSAVWLFSTANFSASATSWAKK